MSKDDIDSDYPQHSLSGCHSKLAMLRDLFAGHTESSLCLSEAGIDGLCNLLRDVGETIEAIQEAIPNRAVIESRAVGELRH